MSATIAAVSPTEKLTRSTAASRSILTLAACFAIIAGFVEAIGLALFQKINWANWGHTGHVSAAIFWVAPFCDLLLFIAVAVALVLLAYLAPALPVVDGAVFLFAVLMFYDWLALPERLVHRSALILSVGLAAVTLRLFRKHRAASLRLSQAAVLWLLAAVPLTWAAVHGANWIREQVALRNLPQAPANAPNVVVLVVDTLRWDHLSAAGYSRPTTPNLDKIAQQGTLFENAISTSSWTLPSHASLLTGRYTFEHGAADVTKWGKALDDRYPTIAEVMRDHGYRTGAFSGNYLYFSGNLGFGRGFLHFEDYFHSFFDGFTRTEYGREFSRLIFSREKIRKSIIRIGFPSIDELQPNGIANWMYRKRASTVNREALSWIDAGGKKPFFLFLNYFDVHRSYTTPPGSPRKFLNLDTHALWLQQWSDQSPDASSIAYDECIAYEDTQLQNFFDELTKRGLSDHTLVIITSDHGDLLGEHGLYAHRNSLFRPLINVPLIFWQPGRVPAGVKIDTPVSNSLLPATIVDMLQLSGNSPSLFPGPSLAGLWNLQTPPPSVPHPISEIAHLENESKKSPSRYGAMSSLVTPQYHYIVHEKFGPQLYDWVHDPEEKNNLADTPEGKNRTTELAQELQSLMARPR